MDTRRRSRMESVGGASTWVPIVGGVFLLPRSVLSLVGVPFGGVPFGGVFLMGVLRGGAEEEGEGDPATPTVSSVIADSLGRYRPRLRSLLSSLSTPQVLEVRRLLPVGGAISSTSHSPS